MEDDFDPNTAWRSVARMLQADADRAAAEAAAEAEKAARIREANARLAQKIQELVDWFLELVQQYRPGDLADWQKAAASTQKPRDGEQKYGKGFASPAGSITIYGFLDRMMWLSPEVDTGDGFRSFRVDTRGRWSFEFTDRYRERSGTMFGYDFQGTFISPDRPLDEGLALAHEAFRYLVAILMLDGILQAPPPD